MKMNVPQVSLPGTAVERHLAAFTTTAPAEGQNGLPRVSRAVGGLAWLLGSPKAQEELLYPESKQFLVLEDL